MSGFLDRRITFETKCWERDWQRLLLTDRLEAMVKRNCYPFSERVLMINNVTDYDRVCSCAEAAIKKGYLTRYIVVKDHAEEALNFFGLTREALGKGYVYSIAELVSIYLCRTEFLLHYSGDTIPSQTMDWLADAIALFDKDQRVRVANLTWNNRFQEARAEAIGQTDKFYLGFGFSDQSYFVRTSDFRARIYSEWHPFSERYPRYGGELFEKRVDSWMRNHQFLRATYCSASYQHTNI